MFTKKILLLFFVLIFFSGCLEYEETLKILPNGWVRGEISFSAPNSFFEKMSQNDKYKIFKLMTLPRKEAIKELPDSMQLMEWYIEKRGVNWTFHTNFYIKKTSSFDSMGALLAGQKIKVTVNDGKITFKRFIDYTDMGKMIASQVENSFIRKQLLLTSVFKYKIIVPTEIISSNATKETPKEVEWDYKLLDLASAPQIMKVTFATPPFYMLPIFWLLLGFFLMIGYIILLLKKL